MIKVLLDNDIEGFRPHLVAALENLGWDSYGVIELVTLTEVGLARETNDRAIWRFCQSNSLLLPTANRNEDDPDSLGLTMQEENTEHSLPIITFSDQERLPEASYRETCIESLLAIVLDLQNNLSTGRLYIP